MKSTNRLLIEGILQYFSLDRKQSLCNFFYFNNGSSDLYELMLGYGKQWERSFKDGFGNLLAYFIPSPNGGDYDAAIDSYYRDASNWSMTRNPMRREFGNFMLRELCRKMKIKIIQLPK